MQEKYTISTVRMRRRALLASLGALAVPASAAEPIKVVASFSILADMVREIGGDEVSVTALVPPDGDAHTYEPRPSDLLAIQAAKLVVTNGLGLDAWMDRLIRGAGGSTARVVASAAVTPRRMSEGGRQVLDPHAWQDPRNGVFYARAIMEGLIRATPDRADLLRAQGERYLAAIRETDAWIERTLAPVPPPKRKIITSHDAFGYFGARYGIEFHAAQGIDTDAEPSARDLARLAAQIRREHIRAVFVENMTDPRIARALAREAGAVVGGTVYSDALSPPGGPAATYLAMFRHNTTLFATAMAEN
jgi:zinc/manganese transport system substrate-binding protein